MAAGAFSQVVDTEFKQLYALAGSAIALTNASMNVYATSANLTAIHGC